MYRQGLHPRSRLDEAARRRPRVRAIGPEVSTQRLAQFIRHAPRGEAGREGPGVGCARREVDRESDMNGRTVGNLILMTLICVVIFVVFMAMRPAPAGETPIYGPDGKYQGRCSTTARRRRTPTATVGSPGRRSTGRSTSTG